MNYMAEIKAFYELQTFKPLSTGQIALWHALMHINNKCAWTEWFTVPNSTLQSLTGLARRTVYQARNVLKQNGLIDFRESKNSEASKYHIIALSENAHSSAQSNAHSSAQSNAHSSAQSNAHSSALLNNTDTDIDTDLKEKGYINISPKEKRDVFAEYAGEDTTLLEALRDFEAMRKQVKKPLTSDRAKKMLINQLDNLATSSTEKIAVLEQSILHNWLTVYALKDNQQQRINPAKPAEYSCQEDDYL